MAVSLDPIREHAAVIDAFVVNADFAVVSKSNYRQDARSKSRWRSLAGFEQLLALTARQQIPPSWPTLDPSVPLHKRPTFTATIVAATTLDAANVPKSVTDALEGVVYVDDAAVRHVTSLTRRKREPRFCVGIAALHPATGDPATYERTLADVGALVTAATLDVFHTA